MNNSYCTAIGHSTVDGSPVYIDKDGQIISGNAIIESPNIINVNCISPKLHKVAVKDKRDEYIDTLTKEILRCQRLLKEVIDIIELDMRLNGIEPKISQDSLQRLKAKFNS